MSQMLEKHQFIVSGLNTAGMSPCSSGISYFKRVYVDDLNNVAFASLSVDNKRVLITARRETDPLSIKSELPHADYYDDDLEAQGTGLAFYWENPWEIKASIKRGLETVKLNVSKYLRKTKAQILNEVFVDSEPEFENWIVTSVCVDNVPILGDPSGHPEMASRQLDSVFGQKSDYSIQRTKIFLTCMISSVFVLGIRRAYLNHQMKPGFAFAKQFILSHPSVVKFYDYKKIDIISRCGEFKPKKIDAEITIGCRDDSVEGIVKFGASRQKEEWMVNSALFTPNGAKPIDLLVR